MTRKEDIAMFTNAHSVRLCSYVGLRVATLTKLATTTSVGSIYKCAIPITTLILTYLSLNFGFM